MYFANRIKPYIAIVVLGSGLLWLLTVSPWALWAQETPIVDPAATETGSTPLHHQTDSTDPVVPHYYLPLVMSGGAATDVNSASAIDESPAPTTTTDPQIYLPLVVKNLAPETSAEPTGVEAAAVESIDVQINHSADDAEEAEAGYVLLTNGDLELVDDAGASQTVGLRFDAVAIPQGATIVNAYLQFYVDEPNDQSTSLTIQGEATDNASRYTWDAGNISGRPRTIASVPWTPPAWGTVGTTGPAQRTTNIAPVVQEIVNRSGWAKWNALAIIMTGSGVRTAEAFDGDAAKAATLHVEFDPDSSAGAPVIVAVGDIASCDTVADEATALVVDAIPGTVVNLGDSVYPDGTAAEFNDCYEPSWGRHRTRTRPAPGNHDYHTPGASGYFNYFGAAAGDPNKGYYSYDIGDWHIIVLNSECGAAGGCRGNSPQMLWLKADLAANSNTCTLAYWHHPRFSSSATHGSNSHFEDFWQALHDAGADVVLNGHAHLYERFGLQDPTGVADPANGIRQFTVGTGGAGLYPFAAPEPNSEVREADTYGVLKMTLHPTSYDWEFVPIAGQTFSDTGSASCVGASAPPASQSIEVRVNGSSDDAEEAPSGNIPLTNSDLELVDDTAGSQIVGMRFSSVDIAQGATIANAYIQFQADETNDQPTTLSIYGEAADDAQTFYFYAGNISSRPSTAATVDWSPLPWTTVGESGADQRTTNIAPIIQEIVNRPGWQSGNALTIMVAGSGVRTAESYDGDPNSAPLLHVDLQGAPTGGESGQVDVRVANGADDVEEALSGNVAMTSSDLELVENNGEAQTVGVRFLNIDVPQGATITDAYIQFQVDEKSGEPVSVWIHGEDSDDAPEFVGLNGNVSTRAQTTATAFWSPEPWDVTAQAEEAQRTPSLVDTIQEIVDRPGWVRGNAMAFIFSGTGVRTAESFEGDPNAAPLLHIEFVTP